ncbi:MAG: alpha/beta hydrolase, partial [Planctomycetota bacterium]
MIKREVVFLSFGLFAWVGLSLVGISVAQDDVVDVPCSDLFAGGDKNKRYFLIGDGEGAKVPEKGFSLLIILPGGDGGPDFNTFVKRIYKNSLSNRYLVAQLVSVKWTPKQVIVWPTESVRVDGQKFSTEEFVEAVVGDIKSKYTINEKNIFTLSWSSGGPAGYAISVRKQKSVTGSYIAMSVFKPDNLGSLEHVAGHRYFIDHSPEDKVCPFRMAKSAYKILREHGARTRLVTYKGGHGWRGNVYERIRRGIRWLETPVRRQG